MTDVRRPYRSGGGGRNQVLVWHTNRSETYEGTNVYGYWDKCLSRDETASHIACDCEALATLELCYLEHHFMEPGDYLDAPSTNSLYNFCWLNMPSLRKYM
jgi:hypothetical protein